MIGNNVHDRLLYKAMTLTLCILVAVGSLSCQKMEESSALVNMEVRQIPLLDLCGEEKLYPMPVNLLLAPDGSWVAAVYLLGTPTGPTSQVLCMMMLDDGERRRLDVGSWRTRVLSVCNGERLAVVPFASSEQGYFWDIKAWRRIGPEFPGGFARVTESGGGEILTVEKEDGDIVMVEARRGTTCTFGAGRHGLAEPDALIVGNRLVVSGWREDLGRLETQIWSLPDHVRIASLQASVDAPMAWANCSPQKVGSTAFAFFADAGLWKVVALDSGRVLYEIGSTLPREQWLGHGKNIVRILEDNGYVDRKGCLVWRQELPGERCLSLFASDVSKEEILAERSFPSGETHGVEVAEVEGDYVVLHMAKSSGCLRVTGYRIPDFTQGVSFEVPNYEGSIVKLAKGMIVWTDPEGVSVGTIRLAKLFPASTVSPAK